MTDLSGSIPNRASLIVTRLIPISRGGACNVIKGYEIAFQSSINRNPNAISLVDVPITA